MPLDEDGVPTLTADPKALQDVTESIRATLQNINKVVADNQEAVKNSLLNLETFTASLARNSGVNEPGGFREQTGFAFVRSFVLGLALL